jgi:hypothetical protein
MTLRYSEKVRNAGLDARIEAIGPAPSLHLRGADGEPLATLKLPRVWMTKAANGVVQKAGDWNGRAHRAGRVTSFRFEGADGNHIDGVLPDDMTLDNPLLEKGQQVGVDRFIISAGNAAATN